MDLLRRFTLYKILTIGLLCLLSACNSINKPNEITSISISPFDKNYIKVEYRLPTNKKTIPLKKIYGERTLTLRNNWQELNHCGHISKEGELTQDKNCVSVSFLVPVEASFIDRVNPIAYPMGEEGVLINTATFGLDTDPVIWNFVSSEGPMIIDGTLARKKFSARQSQENRIYYVSVFFSYRKSLINTHLIITDSVPDTLKNGINEGSQKISEYYINRYSYKTFIRPSLFINNLLTENAIEQSDITHRMIRFGFSNWSSERLQATLQVVAHEFAHALQPTNITDPIVSEGGAEFVSWQAGYNLGWWDKYFMGSYLSASIQRCLEMSNKTSWKQIKDSLGSQGNSPYACGWAIHTIALASRQNAESAEQTLNMYYTDAPNNGQIDFATALECGHNKDCKAEFLSAFLNSDKSMAEVIDKQLHKLGVIKNQRYTANNGVSAEVGQKALSQLMSENCDGAYGSWLNKDHFLSDASQCKNIKNGLKITSVEGFSYFNDTINAVAAQNNACIKKHLVTLETLDHQKISVPCSKSFEVAKNYYELDMDKLLKLLEQRQ